MPSTIKSELEHYAAQAKLAGEAIEHLVKAINKMSAIRTDTLITAFTAAGIKQWDAESWAKAIAFAYSELRNDFSPEKLIVSSGDAAELRTVLLDAIDDLSAVAASVKA